MLVCPSQGYQERFILTDAPALDLLTPRQREILTALAAGRSPQEIAATLNVATCTVYQQIRRAQAALGARTRAQAAAMWSKGEGAA